MSHPALLYDPVSGTSRRVTITWNAGFHGTLRIEDSSGDFREIAAADLSLTQGGWRGDSINIAWQREGQTWAVTVDDRDAITNLANELPSALSTQIVRWQKQNKRGARLSATVLAVGLLAALLPLSFVMALFLMRDRILDVVIEKLPTSIDAEISRLMHEDLVGSGKVVKDGASAEALRVLRQRFLPHLPAGDFTFRFEVVNDSSMNAFAAPGGLIVVHTGLLAKATSVDQVVGVLGHEITHVTRRHSLRQIIYDMGSATTLRWLLGVPDGAVDTIAHAAVNLSGLKFSREQETEADAGGIELLQKARLPATGLQSFFEMLEGVQGTVPSFLSTHPADKDRSTLLQKLISERGRWEVDPLEIDWETVRRDAEERVKKK